MNRSEAIARIKGTSCWDVIIIGGGATGLGTALEASTRGYKTLLIEQSDFAKSTSSKSTKLVHGGVRYLAQGNIALVREASVERGLLYKNAPHLVKNQSFIIPVYNVWDRLKYTIGLKLYDWISGRLSMGSSVFISRKETLQKLPNLNSKNLAGGILYHDGQFDDSRLAINLAQSIFDHDGCAINYVKVTSLLKQDQNRVCGVVAKDQDNGHVFNIQARAVINATGVFADEILKMDDPAALQTLCVSQGVHLVLDKKYLNSDHALMIPKTTDGRVLFAVPWHGKVVVGTTDTPVKEAVLEPRALEEEVNFILKTASGFLAEKPELKDILSVFAGLRPLAVTQGNRQKTKEISRSHKIMVTPSSLFTILGGKWTTYRKMGEDLINKVEKELAWNHRQTVTATLPVHGYSKNVKPDDPFYIYGSDSANIQKLMDGSVPECLSSTLGIHKAQVQWAVTEEMAMTVEDFLSRRTRALLLDASESIRIASSVAKVMADFLGKDRHWIESQVQTYTSLAQRYLPENRS